MDWNIYWNGGMDYGMDFGRIFLFICTADSTVFPVDSSYGFFHPFSLHQTSGGGMDASQ